MKQMKRLKRKLLVQIRSRGGPESVAHDREFLRSQEQFYESEKSLRRVQAAMVAWAGALDALSSCSQTLAEELARHTILVTRPTEPADHGRGDPATFCRALQGMMSATESVARPAHAVFVSGALRPLMETFASDVSAMHARLNGRKKKLEVYSVLRKRHPRYGSTPIPPDRANASPESKHGHFARKASGSSSASAEIFSATDEEARTDAKTKRERVDAAERALSEATESCLLGLRSFREKEIRRLPESIGMAIGCYHGFAVRLAALLAPYLPQFPRAACAVVDIAHAASITKDRALQRKLVQIEAATHDAPRFVLSMKPITDSRNPFPTQRRVILAMTKMTRQDLDEEKALNQYQKQ
ncbi:Hypothetical Protein FCC1311_082042 [Hondaea fermentalgiana]|uniref:BAR domain-containing protein n=1 Tax=Hondaea fermentalgiana TaxID=2315210 RepID=A0A2R5GNV0_9STRA|nr:Hypothetical Protein FCC1311_082042 [Hondaea fermentalgiana]|eukprot:GBG31979.1 Hypothetical Protein FCC1311_082042 [Hondaea fermentalgiana]